MTGKDPFEYVRDWRLRLDSTGWWHSFELPDGTHIEGVNSLDSLKHRLAQFPIPDDLKGKRVLDVGAWDGWFSFEMERRGAEVLALDVWDNPRFREMRSLLDSRVDYRIADVYDLSPGVLGRFDIVLFLGVLYHLKHPLLALERICSVTTGLAAIESFVIEEKGSGRARASSRPVMEFYETDEFGGQTDNWVGPNLACLLAFCRTAGFARVELQNVLPYGACVACHRGWDEGVDESRPAPRLAAATHHTNSGINFSSGGDDYVTCWFEGLEDDLRPADVQPEVGDFGTRPIYVWRMGESAWQMNFKLPPGLDAGWHQVRVRVRNGPRSNDVPVAVDVPLRDDPVAITAVGDGTTWASNRLERNSGNTLCLWVSGLPENADRANVRVLLGSGAVPVTYIEPLGADDEPRQVNVEVPEGVPEGNLEVRVFLGQVDSDPVEVEVVA